jgi:hypothetical protein
MCGTRVLRHLVLAFSFVTIPSHLFLRDAFSGEKDDEID